jgi:hypothetical protein
MAINVNTQDLINYPGINKTVSVDLANIVPLGYEGDEQIVMVISTSAYSNNTNRTTISNLYITEAKSGWLKSSGLVGGRFPLDSTHNTMRIKLDNTISGSDGSGWYTVSLLHDNGIPLAGEIVAADLETKIQSLADSLNLADEGFALAYKNCMVEFDNNKFKIVSGSVGNYYVGANKTAVTVASGLSNDCSAMLGFNLPVSSEVIASTAIKESLITADYVANATTLWIGTGTGVVAKDAMFITDASGNYDYFIAQNVVGDTQVTVVSGSITHSYTAGLAKVQRLKAQDPDNQPLSPFASIDALGRHGIKHMTNQIDYSS